MSKAIIRGITSASIMTIIIIAVIFGSVESFDWRHLWIETRGTIPIIFIVLAVVIFSGFLTGVIAYLIQNKEIKLIKAGLNEVIDQKTVGKIHYYGEVKETEEVFQRIVVIQTKLDQVTNRLKQVIEERNEDQEEQIERRLTEERNRLARELHDSVSQELFATSMLVSALNEMSITSTDQLTEPLEQIERMIQQAQLEMRALLLHLRPIALKNHSLKEGIDQLLTELVDKVPIMIDWRTEDLILPRAVEDNLFRILQESLSNALRHAKSNRIDVLLIKRDGRVILSVIDDGIGFNQEQEMSSSYGLANMEERATEIGGELRIVSLPNQGTKLTVNVPVIQEEG